MNEEREYLYSPWRLDYVSTAKEPGCILCRHKDRSKDKEHLILHRAPHCFVMQNLYPYNNGHLMVVPYDHCDRLSLLTAEQRADLMETVALCERVLKEVYSCDGINVGLNLGEAAGAGIAEHLHIHLVPRWKGDSNFMSVVSGLRVIPESFASSYERLQAGFAKALPNKD